VMGGEKKPEAEKIRIRRKHVDGHNVYRRGGIAMGGGDSG